jgi:hypothetical protein
LGSRPQAGELGRSVQLSELVSLKLC